MLLKKYMVGLLYECKLPTQNRLFDIGKKALLSMSMTEIYALSVVAHFSFTRAVAAASENSQRGNNI